MPINNNSYASASDNILVGMIGTTSTQRVAQDLTQDQVAEKSGINRSTIAKLENGRAATMLTIVKVLRAIDRLDVLQPIFDKPQPTPYVLMEQQAIYEKAQRKRASGKEKVILPLSQQAHGNPCNVNSGKDVGW